MNETLILEKLDSLTKEIQSLKSGVLEELRQDLMPIISQYTPRVTGFMADMEGRVSNDELALLVKNILLNVQNLNGMLNTLKSATELGDDLAPVLRLLQPKVITFLNELDGQLKPEEAPQLLRKTLANLENFSSGLDLLKAGAELTQDLAPVMRQMQPKVISFFNELDGQFKPGDLALLLRKTLTNLENFNTGLDLLKAGAELGHDVAPILGQMQPKAIAFFNELDGQFKPGDLALLLRKTLTNLENFNTGLDLLKAGAELGQDLGPVLKQMQPKAISFFNELDGQFKPAELTALLRKTLANLENFNMGLDTLKAGAELAQDLSPVLARYQPKVISFFNEIDGQFKPGELPALLRKTLMNLENFSEGLDTLKAVMELKEDVSKIAGQQMPKLVSFLAEVQDQLSMEDLGSLVRHFVVNLQNFNRMMSMVKPGAELMEDLAVVFKQYDAVSKIVLLLHDLEQRGVFRILARVSDALKGFRCSEGQLDTVCTAITEIDFGKPSHVGPLDMLNEIRDPNVQETLGATFKLLRAVGCCLRANRIYRLEQQFPEEPDPARGPNPGAAH